MSEYSRTVLDHARNPRNLGQVEQSDAFAQVTGLCGDTMRIWLKVAEGRVVQATFWTDGCGTTFACGSMATELATGKTLEEVLGMDQQEILDALGGLPRDSVRCALLAAKTLKEPARGCMSRGRDAT